MRSRATIVLLAILGVSPLSAVAQRTPIPVRDLVRLYNPDHERCHGVYEGVHRQIVDDSGYRPAREGEAAVNLNFVCQDSSRDPLSLITVALTLGYGPANAVFMQMHQSVESDESEAVEKIMDLIDDTLQTLREEREKIDAMDEAEWTAAVADHGGNEHVLLALRKILQDLFG